MGRVGVFMGSFDPPHIGHISVVVGALESGLVDKVLIVPAWKNVWKDTKTSFEDRISMCSRAFSDTINAVYVSHIEQVIAQNDPKYITGVPSHVTMKQLYSMFSKEKICFITTEQTYAEIPMWERGDEIINLYKFIICGRDYEVPRISISSTLIRNKLDSGKSGYPYITKDVQDYINQNNLYEEL